MVKCLKARIKQQVFECTPPGVRTECHVPAYPTSPAFPCVACLNHCSCYVLQALRPTAMPVVPRVLNRFHDKVVQGMLAAGGLKAKLFIKACEAKVRKSYHTTVILVIVPSMKRRRDGNGGYDGDGGYDGNGGYDGDCCVNFSGCALTRTSDV